MMNKFTFLLAILTAVFVSAGAQNLLDKVPLHASVVMKYSGKSFSEKMPLKKLDTYPFIKNNLFKILKIDSLTSLQNIGIDVEQDSYQYVSTGDSAISFVSLLHLKNIPQFLSMVNAHYQAELKPEKMNGYEFISISANTYVGWNNEYAVFVITNYSNPNRYRYNFQADTTIMVDSTSLMADSMISLFDSAATAKRYQETAEEIEEKPVPESNAGKFKSKKPQASQKKVTGSSKTKKKPVKVPQVEEVVPNQTIDKANDEDITISEAPVEDLYFDSAAEAKREAWNIEQSKIVRARQKKIAVSIIEKSFTGAINSIRNDISYKSIIDSLADVSVWLNYGDLLKQYWLTDFATRPFMMQPGSGDIEKNAEKDIAFRSSANMYFEKDRLRIEQKTFSPDKEMAKMRKQLFHSKQSKSLAKFVNPDNVGYLSVSINSEAMANYYYKIIKQYLSNTPYIGDYAAIIDVYIDLLEIIIDEKAIAELMPGNYLFVLHDMRKKEVSYTTYEYDDNFKSTEVKKTKQELSPNFIFIMETKKEGFMQKLVNLPLKYAKEGKYNYQDRGGYYELVFDSGKNILNGIYFMVKEGKVIVTTSKASIDMAMNNTGYALDEETKKSILNNNYSMQLYSKRLIQQLGPELTAGVNQKINNYLQQNMGDVKLESRLKDGMMQGTTTMNITGDHGNSLEFFFNMIDTINTIMEEDKKEGEQKFN